ncbi:hypothetical protein EVAR_33663_1 [Eumeta japonica]|uniref:peptide-methionine (S)-S-oxide reductase n=1 Tax=Eumeta variegata TaxID=151549 RepID=A0A4C1VLU6_EUMVA|nr:hypothetical protein EVAR_33663_1 [Eumeta japonica]
MFHVEIVIEIAGTVFGLQIRTINLLHDVDVPTKKATFGMGCFWSNDSLFGATPGVVRTRVGYAGGTSKNPHYRSMLECGILYFMI